MSIALHGGGREARSREWYLEAGREYVRRYGADQLTQAALNPAAAKRNGRPDLVDRYYDGRLDGTMWPSLNAVKKVFGTFNAYRAELGLLPNSTGPATGRRKAGQADPIFTVRERRVVVPDAATVWLRNQLGKAERRAERLAERLDEAQVREVRVEDVQKITQLRERLADERARHRAVRKELAKAERRDRSALREIERLTERLVEVKAQTPKVITKTIRAPGKTVTKTVQVTDARLLAEIAKLETQVTDLRASLRAAQTERAELVDRLADVRADATAKAMETLLVRRAERRAAEAEARMAALAELVVGERRQLTDEEIEDLRSDGPAGRAVFVAMVKRAARAEGSGALRDALTDVIAAALNWKDRL